MVLLLNISKLSQGNRSESITTVDDAIDYMDVHYYTGKGNVMIPKIERKLSTSDKPYSESNSHSG